MIIQREKNVASDVKASGKKCIRKSKEKSCSKLRD